jgi:hypothetical protein
MATLLAKRIEALEAAMGGVDSLAIGRVCPDCQAHVVLDDAGPCASHRPLREAQQVLLVTFVDPTPKP